MYTNVKVTNICSDGTLYCQVPCKGLNKLSDLLHKTEDYFHCKVWQSTISRDQPQTVSRAQSALG